MAWRVTVNESSMPSTDKNAAIRYIHTLTAQYASSVHSQHIKWLGQSQLEEL